MRELLAARRMRFYCNRPWQSIVPSPSRPRVAAIPATFMQAHPDAKLTITARCSDARGAPHLSGTRLIDGRAHLEAEPG